MVSRRTSKVRRMAALPLLLTQSEGLHPPISPQPQRPPPPRQPKLAVAGPAELVTCDQTIETTYLEIKSSILGGRVLRARTPTGIDQEVYALLVTYQILRLAMADATGTQPDVDPDRASFTIALQTARDQLVKAAGVLAATAIDLVGTIGRHVLDNLMPDRRLRVAPRIVKRAISKYNARGPSINRTSYKATLSIDILEQPNPLTTRPEP